MAEVRVVIKSVDEGSKNVQNFGQKLEGVLDIAKKSAVAVAAAGATFKKAFDLSKEGANLTQLTESFDLMNASVYKTPDLLDQMSAAARGTIKETDLMAGLLTLTAGTTDLVAQAMAGAAPQLLEIAKASNKLNPALGDTTFLFESISKGIKRQSPLILDNLGLNIKMEAAYRAMADSLGISVDSLDANQRTMAVLNATLEAGGQLINQVGGDVDSQADAWARLEVIVATNTDRFKQFLADGLLPTVSALAGDYGKAAEAAADSTLETAQSAEQLTTALAGANSSYDLSRTALGRMTGTTDEATAANVDLALKLAAVTNNADEYKAALTEAGTDILKIRRLVEESGQGFVLQGVAIGDTAQALIDYARASEEAAAADANLVNYIYDVNQVQGDNRTESEKAADAMAAMGMIVEDTQTSYASYTVGLLETEAAQKAAAESMKYMTGIVDAARGPVGELMQAQEDLTAAQGEWVNVTRDSSGQIADINEQLAYDLSDDQKKAYQEILDTVGEGSAEWLSIYNALQGDLTDSQRAALVAQQADLQNAQGEIINVYTGDAEAAEDAQARMDAANAAIAESYRAAAAAMALQKISDVYGADALGAQEAYLTTQVALGQMSQAQADSLLDIAEKTQRVNDVTGEMMDRYLEDGQLTADEAANIAAAVTLIEESTYLTGDAIIAMAESGVGKFGDVSKAADGLKGSADNATTAVRAVQSMLDGLQDKEITITVNQINRMHDEWQVPEGYTPGGGGRALGGPVFPGNAYPVGEFNRPELLKTPGGLYLIPGDQGQVVPTAQGGGGGITIQNLNITISGGNGNGRMMGKQIAATVATELGRLN